jgi:hypothetical protein
MTDVDQKIYNDLSCISIVSIRPYGAGPVWFMGERCQRLFFLGELEMSIEGVDDNAFTLSRASPD